MVGRPLRLILFADSGSDNSVTLLARCLRVAATRSDTAVAAIVDTGPGAATALRTPARRLARRVGRFSSLGVAQPPLRPFLATCATLGRTHRIPVLTPGEQGVNDSRFVDAICRLQPDATLSLMVVQIFRAPLLEACRAPVNYHNGLLPHYRGVAATGWSIYQRAAVSGFTFHLMTAEVDGGAVLTQGAVPLDERSTAPAVEVAKTRRANAQVGEVLRLLHAPFEIATEQRGPGSMFTRADLRQIRTIEEPEAFPLDELERRLRAFERLDLLLGDRWWSVTALRRITTRARNAELAFTTADGVAVEPARIRHLPAFVYRMPIGVATCGPPA